MDDVIWSCPGCGTDLAPTEAGVFWCAFCERTVTPPQVGDDPPEYEPGEEWAWQ